MRNFADFRKDELRETIKDLCVREGVETQFEILRIELTEAIKLPDLPLNEGILAEAGFHRLQRDDFEENKVFLEEVIRVYKTQFYDELLQEAEATSQLGTSLSQLGRDLKEKILELIDVLRTQVSAILKTTRSPEDAEDLSQSIGADLSAGDTAGDPSSPVGGGPATGGSPFAAPSGTPSGAAPSGAAPSAAPSASSGTGTTYAGAGFGPSGVASTPSTSPSGDKQKYPRWSDYRGDVRPKQGEFTPAPYGSLRPSDSVRGGLSRLWRRATRPVRRVWHGDPSREMSKEHTELFETLFLENWDQVSGIIDKFQDDVMKYIDARIKQIGDEAGTPVAATPTPETGVAGTSPVVRGGEMPPDAEATPDAEAEAEEAGQEAGQEVIARGGTQAQAKKQRNKQRWQDWLKLGQQDLVSEFMI